MTQKHQKCKHLSPCFRHHLEKDGEFSITQWLSVLRIFRTNSWNWVGRLFLRHFASAGQMPHHSRSVTHCSDYCHNYSVSKCTASHHSHVTKWQWIELWEKWRTRILIILTICNLERIQVMCEKIGNFKVTTNAIIRHRAFVTIKYSVNNS